MALSKRSAFTPLDNSQRHPTGFTLIEMMIVISIIAILVGVLLPSFRGTQDEALIQRGRSELRTLATALESYYIHNSNAYPLTLTPLITATPRIISRIPDDPFRTATNYSYSVSTQYYVVFSWGADRTVDITSINPSGQLVGGTCGEDVFVTNGLSQNDSGSNCTSQ